jgi:DNA anti-recombination protein RmuC
MPHGLSIANSAPRVHPRRQFACLQEKLQMIMSKMQQAVLILLLCVGDTTLIQQQQQALSVQFAAMQQANANEAATLKEHMVAMQAVLEKLAQQGSSDADVQACMQEFTDSMLALSERAVQQVGDACTALQQEVSNALGDVGRHVHQLALSFHSFGQLLQQVADGVQQVSEELCMLKEGQDKLFLEVRSAF